MKTKNLLELVENLLDSGVDEGCERGLVVVGLDEFDELREFIHEETGVWRGSITPVDF